jgi:hypothetical protein
MVAISREGEPHKLFFLKGDLKMAKGDKKVVKEGKASSMVWGIKNPGKVANQAPPGAGKGKIGPNLSTKTVRK